MRFLGLYVPAALSRASDFLRASLIGAIAATISADDLAAFSASYRLHELGLVLSGSWGCTAGLAIAQHLGAGDVAGAKRAAHSGMRVAAVAVTALACAVTLFLEPLGWVLMGDSGALSQLLAVRWPLAGTTLAMNALVVLEQLLLSAGCARSVFYGGLVGSWACQLPTVLLLVLCWRAELLAVYTGVALGYAIAAAILAGVLLNLDWPMRALQQSARGRRGGGRRSAT